MTKDEEIASLEAKLAASKGLPGYERRTAAIQKRLDELRNAV